MSNAGQVKKASQETEINTLEGVICSCAGSRIAPVYKRLYDEELHRNIVKKVDEIDLFEFIQASKSMTDLASLEKRMIATGEIPAVDPSLVGDGIDFTTMPKDIHEVYSMINDIDNNFSKLPESVQKVFGTKQAYVQSVIDGTLQSKLIAALGSQTVPADTKKDEGNTNE